MSQWPAALAALIEQGQKSVLITIVSVQGSVPRGAGTKMIVSAKGLEHGTIGGGNLEFQCIAHAHQLLQSVNHSRDIKRFPLAASLGQCCGGVVEVLFEYIDCRSMSWLNELLDIQAKQLNLQLATPLTDPLAPKQVTLLTKDAEKNTVITDGVLYEAIEANDFNVVVFGAGHVGKAIVRVLEGVDCAVTWVDSRRDEFPEITASNIKIIEEDNPEDAIETAAIGSYFLILTHSHSLDLFLCEKVLKRGDFRYCGLIGSQSKRAKFKHRLSAKGFTERQIASLTCPIGIDGLNDKQPGHIAVSVAAQLLQLQQGR